MTKRGDGSGAGTAAREAGPAPAARAHAERGAPDLGGVKVGVVIPAYRVAQQIAGVIRGIPPWIQSIVVVEDASPDDTAARVAALGDPRVTLIRHERNQGVGGAMATGFAEAVRSGLDVVVKMDGDGQMDPADLPAMIAPLLDGRADVVKGNRYASLAHVKEMPTVRLIGNAGLTFLVKSASGYWNTFDPANGYLAMRTAVLERIDLERLPKRYYFESGFLVELGILRAAVVDVSITARYGDEVSSLSVPRTLFEFPPRLLKGLLRRLFWRYLVHDFSAVSVFLLLGVPLFVVGSVLGTSMYWKYATMGEYAPPGLVMLSAMPIILGVQLILQAVVLDIQNVPRVPISPPLPRA
jgi:glycosyltransferase involved in cell wall biosynthesis